MRARLPDLKVNFMSTTFNSVIKTEQELREILGHPNEIVTNKTITKLDDICLNFIAAARFLTIASADSQGNMDVSPKGDYAGFVQVLDDRTLVIPDRPGNKKGDTLTNILQNPKVGLLFMIPGVRETLRVNGYAKIVTDANLLETMKYKNKLPLFGIVVHVEEIFMHCAKCIVRSGLWAGESESTTAAIPTLGEALVQHTQFSIDAADLDVAIRLDEETNLY